MSHGTHPQPFLLIWKVPVQPLQHPRPNSAFRPLRNEELKVEEPNDSTLLTQSQSLSLIPLVAEKVVPSVVDSSPARTQKSNPHRNILTNITNLMLNQVLCQPKSRKTLLSIDPNLTEDDLFHFFQYVKQLKTSFSSYYNAAKLKRLFGGRTLPRYNHKLHRLFTIMARLVL